MRVPRADQSAACTVRWRGSWRGFWGLKGFVTGRYVGRVKGYSCVVALKLGVWHRLSISDHSSGCDCVSSHTHALKIDEATCSRREGTRR